MLVADMRRRNAARLWNVSKILYSMVCLSEKMRLSANRGSTVFDCSMAYSHNSANLVAMRY